MLLCGWLVAGCGGDGGGGAAGSGGAGGGGSGGSSGADMAKSSGDGGLLGLAQPCTTNAQCQSNLCAPYMMGTKMLCSYACTKNMPAPMCTAPGNGQCNGMGYCQFPNM